MGMKGILVKTGTMVIDKTVLIVQCIVITIIIIVMKTVIKVYHEPMRAKGPKVHCP